MADQTIANADDLVEQWTFDFYVNKCVSEFCQVDGKIESSWRYMLQMLMTRSVNPDYAHNRAKAHLLIVLSNQLHLVEMDVASFPENCAILKSKEEAAELLNQLDELRISLMFLAGSDQLKSDVIEALCHQCLLLTCVFMFQVVDQLKEVPEPVFTQQQSSKLMKRMYELLETTVDLDDSDEKEILQTCKKMLTGEKLKPSATDVLPRPIDLTVSLAELVSCVHEKINAKPEILQIAKTWITVQKDGDLDPSRSSAVSDVGKLVEEYSTEEERPSRGKKRTHKRPKRKESSSSDGWSSREPSPGESSPSPSKGGRKRSGESSDHSSKLGMSGIARKFRELEGNLRPKRVEKLVKKPASHAVVKLGPWTSGEEVKFVVSVLKLGPGRWAEVKEDIGAVRSSVQLKDKWRSIPKARVRSIAMEHGLSLSKI